ncbi:hypothetical protein [Elizabethkingia anophelis]|uniref:hypothetical protein n=1 Tax=Elizabethkingia anophelis TaxID=1117645 RepID=UPI0037347842
MLQYRYTLIILLGFIFIPGFVFACGKKVFSSQETSCKTSISVAENCNGCLNCVPKKEHHNCGEQCHCLSCCTTSLLPDIQSFTFETHTHFNKSSFIFTKSNIFKGFLSVWLIPKIG